MKKTKTSQKNNKTQWYIIISSFINIVLISALLILYSNFKTTSDKEKISLYPYLLYRYIDTYCNEFSKKDNETYYCFMKDYGEIDHEMSYVSFVYSHVDKDTSEVSENLQSATIYFNKEDTKKTGITGWEIQNYTEKVEKNGPAELPKNLRDN